MVDEVEKIALEATGVRKSYTKDVRTLQVLDVERFAVREGEFVTIIGPSGCGKSTLLKLMLGEITPTSGEVVIGTRLQLAYFDQDRRVLDPDKTVRENVSESDYVSVQGRSRHVIGYLKDFLFPAQRIDSPVKALSGGEWNRLLLAKIFTRPANMMVLDEPTNNLDRQGRQAVIGLLALVLAIALPALRIELVHARNPQRGNHLFGRPQDRHDLPRNRPRVLQARVPDVHRRWHRLRRCAAACRRPRR